MPIHTTYKFRKISILSTYLANTFVIPSIAKRNDTHHDKSAQSMIDDPVAHVHVQRAVSE